MSIKITVIIPCYNQAHFLRDAVGSVMAQTYKDWEVLIINDGSTDSTESVAMEYCEKDSRINYIVKENGGLSSARNKGLDQATGDYIQFLDADDVLNPMKFEDSMISAAVADIVISNFQYFTTEPGKSTKPSFELTDNDFNFSSILSGWDTDFVFPPHSGIFKASLFENVRFNETLSAREDWLMWLQIYLLKPETFFLNKPYALYRMSDNSMSKNKSLMDENQVAVFRLLYKIIPENYHELFFEKVINTLGGMLTDGQHLLTKTRESKSYRLGNFLIRNLHKLKPGKNSRLF